MEPKESGLAYHGIKKKEHDETCKQGFIKFVYQGFGEVTKC